MMVWDEGTIMLLRQMWADGIPTAEIARRLYTSKNSVVGKAHRLDLPARPSPIRPRGEPRPILPKLPKITLPPLGPRPVSHAPQTTKPVFTAPPPPAAPVYRRPSVECCWPLGQPGTKSFRFCCDTSIPGKPYCGTHAARAYVRVRDQREDAA